MRLPVKKSIHPDFKFQKKKKKKRSYAGKKKKWGALDLSHEGYFPSLFNLYNLFF